MYKVTAVCDKCGHEEKREYVYPAGIIVRNPLYRLPTETHSWFRVCAACLQMFLALSDNMDKEVIAEEFMVKNA